MEPVLAGDVLWVDLGSTHRCLASTVLGGGLGAVRTWVNLQVPSNYARTDPDAHLAEVSAGLPGPVVGMLTADNLLVQETRLHLPTAISILGGVLEWPPSVHHFEQELRKAVGATVADVMDPDLASCSDDDSVEDVATRLHDEARRRLPVVRDGRVVGIVARGDILRAMVEARQRQAD